MKMQFIFSLFASSLLSGCFLRAPSAIMTDEYLEAKNIGQYLRITELDVIKVDTAFKYPSEEKILTSYLLAWRDTKKDVEGNITIKIFFSKKSPTYVWKVYKDMFSANYNYQDTISLKPYTWYKLTTDKFGFYSYFYWNGKKGDYALKLKTKSGAY